MNILDEIDEGRIPSGLVEGIESTMGAIERFRFRRESNNFRVLDVTPRDYRLFLRHRIVTVEYETSQETGLPGALSMAVAQDEHLWLNAPRSVTRIFRKEFAAAGPNSHPLRDSVRSLADLNVGELSRFAVEFLVQEEGLRHTLLLSFEHFVDLGGRFKKSALHAAEDELKPPTLTFDDGAWKLAFNTLCNDNKIYLNTIRFTGATFEIDRETFPTIWPIFKRSRFGVL